MLALPHTMNSTKPVVPSWIEFRSLLLSVCCAAPLMLHAQSPSPSGTVITIAGNGLFGFAGDGGPATNASFRDPFGLAIGPDGTLYFSDKNNYRIRAISPITGIIATVAGNGPPSGGFCDGYGTGDGGMGTNASFCGVFAVAVDRARHALYLADFDNNRVRRVDLTNGIISNYAGTGILGFGFSGDGGPATAAKMAFPIGVATDGAGRLSIADSFNNRVRRVDPVSGLITTIAGNGDTVSAGDGGPATAASFTAPFRVAADSAGNVFVVDKEGIVPDTTNRVRRIDVVTGLITTVAGGGANVPGSGPATSMNLGDVRDLALGGSGTLFIANANQVFQVDLVSGQLSPFAGDGTAGFSGDGGLALSARFDGINGLAVAPGGGLVIADSNNQRIRYVVPDSISLTNDSSQTELHLPWVSALSGDLVVANVPSLTTVNLSSLTNVGGNLEIEGTTALTTFNLASLSTVSGQLTIAGLTLSGDLDLSSVASAGTIVITDFTASGNLDLSSVGSASSIAINTCSVSGNLDLSAVASVGQIEIIGSTVSGELNLGSLVSSGDLTIINSTATTINLSSVTNVSGDLTITDNGVTNINLTSLSNVSGNLEVIGNTATFINLTSVTNISGDLTIVSNAPDASTDLSSLCNFGNETNATTMTVEGNVTVTNCLTLGTNATLAGSATVDGSVTNNGTISPGASPGRFDITGNLVQTSSARLRLEIGGYAPGEFDTVNVLGNVTLGGMLSVSLINNFPGVMTNGASFTLLTAGSPFTGSFANVASGGSLTTKDGYARFTVHYSGETTLRLTDLVIVDSDSDGLPDWWEDRFSLSKTNSADAVLDLDGDGASSLNEFLAGTNPTNAASVFRITGIQSENDDLRITWSTVGGKSYRVQTNSSLTGPFVDFSPLITVSGTGESTTNIVDSGAATNTAAKYYRVRLWP